MKTMTISKANWSGEETTICYWMNDKNVFIGKDGTWKIEVEGPEIRVYEVDHPKANPYEFKMMTADGGKIWIAYQPGTEFTREANHPLAAAFQLAYLLI